MQNTTTQTPQTGTATRSERILSEKLDLLHRNRFPVLANAAVAVVVTTLLWHSFPHPLLLVWLTAVGAVVATRLVMQQYFFAGNLTERCNRCAAWRFAAGSGASGILWGALCLGLPFWGSEFDYVTLVVTCAGMTAGAVATLSIYYPAYLAYVVAFAAPLVGVTAAHHDPNIAGAGVMVTIYFVAISGTARYTNRFVNRTVELSVDNQILRISLEETRVERDAARTDKWSTIAQLSHELRTPLNAILGFSEAMRDEIFGSLGHRRYHEYVAHLLASGKRLSKLTDQMLMLAHGESGTLVMKEGRVDVTALLQHLIESKSPLAARAGLAMIVRMDGELPDLSADMLKLQQLFGHLVDNAIKFTPAGGHIFVAADMLDGGLRISVRDTGIGMRESDIARALEPFARLSMPQTKTTGGAGLGLPICRRLAELHGARLTIQSTPGEGTICAIDFPAERVLARQAETAAA